MGPASDCWSKGTDPKLDIGSMIHADFPAFCTIKKHQYAGAWFGVVCLVFQHTNLYQYETL